jgi:hypothetical protein
VSFELLETAITVVTTTFSVGVLTKIFGRKTPPKQETEEKQCTGYRFGRGVVHKMMDDCTALRSSDCKDGRCTYHCDQMCRCTATIWAERK